MIRSVRLLFVLSVVAGMSSRAETKALKFGRLWDGHRVIANAVVVVEDDRIRSVSADGAVPSGAQTIDLSRFTGVPGMIDMHTHVTYYWNGNPGTNPRRQGPRHVAITVVLSQRNGMKALEAGVTTLRDLPLGELISTYAISLT